MRSGSTQADWLSFLLFAIGSLFNSSPFYRSSAILAALAIFCLISAGLFRLASLLVLIIDLPEAAILGLPLAVIELLLGFYFVIFSTKRGGALKLPCHTVDILGYPHRFRSMDAASGHFTANRVPKR